MLKYKAAKDDNSGIIQIYRFFDDMLLPGKTFIAIRQLISLQSIFESKKSSRFIKSQVNNDILRMHTKNVVKFCRNIVFANELTFFDRTMLNYTIPLKKFEEQLNEMNNEEEMVNAITGMKDIMITLLHSCSFSWINFLDTRERHIWLNSKSLSPQY